MLVLVVHVLMDGCCLVTSVSIRMIVLVCTMVNNTRQHQLFLLDARIVFVLNDDGSVLRPKTVIALPSAGHLVILIIAPLMVFTTVTRVAVNTSLSRQNAVTKVHSLSKQPTFHVVQLDSHAPSLLTSLLSQFESFSSREVNLLSMVLQLYMAGLHLLVVK
jgi:hypothetical protein